MRTTQEEKTTDHDLLIGVSENQHHDQVESYDIAVNSQAIPATSSYELRTTLTTGNHKTMKGSLRGYDSVNVQGHVGVFFLATDNAQEAATIGFVPYGGGVYLSCYMGGYSRMHGDTYLSYTSFGSSIVLRDAYIDGDEAVLEFYNLGGSTNYLTVFGMVVVK